ncbi:hypothetical protein A2372_00415 [Candidatus Wolfebacteria bacterium RIFOXYB1_FULL_54_12]|uniref:Uncharacterized protein n=1 Tax=Candidatus Wolfebacteria bacterium RIFOXYB1_FULL_54_12 TaxID=1802559 RepID=A0A1F8DXI3_9BACT|nr:MAG: hypothetical protein A2372_00415 [Candidatus Wolfebacteria bacterium RIFOXYB1_FULL_54_12]
MKIGLFSVGGLLISLGAIMCAVGMAYGFPDAAYVIDPMIEETQDAWLLFMQAWGTPISYGGLVLMFIGAGIAWFAKGGKTPSLRKKNRFTCKWSRRISP